MHPMPRPPFSPVCFLQKFSCRRETAAEIQNQICRHPPADLPNVLHSPCSVCLIQSLTFMHNQLDYNTQALNIKR